jgi:hypothetical protein
MSPAQLPPDKHRSEGGPRRRACLRRLPVAASLATHRIGFGERVDATEAARAFSELPEDTQRAAWRGLRGEVEEHERQARAEVVAR